MSIKSRLPDKQALQSRIREWMPDVMAQMKKSFGPIEKEYLGARRNSSIGKVLLITGIIFIYLPYLLEINPAWQIGIFLTAFIPFFIGLYKIVKARKIIETFDLNINKAVFPLVFNLLGIEAKSLSVTKEEFRNLHNTSSADQDWSNNQRVQDYDYSKNQKFNEFEDSLLITDTRKNVTRNIITGDSFEINFLDRRLFIQELDVSHLVHHNRNKKWIKHMFIGYFMSFELKKHFNGQTFISTDGDREGFGFQNKWYGVTENTVELDTTELEWNDFEDKLHVSSSDPAEARYLLNLNFMED